DPFASQMRKRPRRTSGGAFSWWISSSGEPDVGGLGTLLALGDIELDALTLFKGAVPLGLNGRVVREHVLSSVVGGDEAESLFGVGPLHGSTGHVTAFFWCKRPQVLGRQLNLVQYGPAVEGVTPEFT